jgi:hypothetical protein
MEMENIFLQIPQIIGVLCKKKKAILKHKKDKIQ